MRRKLRQLSGSGTRRKPQWWPVAAILLFFAVMVGLAWLLGPTKGIYIPPFSRTNPSPPFGLIPLDRR